MIRHVFMAALKPGVEAGALDEAIADLRAMSGKVPGMSGLIVGKNLAWFSDRVQLVLCADFTDRAAWDAFINHPDHVRIGEKYMPLYDPRSITTAQVAY